MFIVLIVVETATMIVAIRIATGSWASAATTGAISGGLTAATSHLPRARPATQEKIGANDRCRVTTRSLPYRGGPRSAGSWDGISDGRGDLRRSRQVLSAEPSRNGQRADHDERAHHIGDDVTPGG